VRDSADELRTHEECCFLRRATASSTLARGLPSATEIANRCPVPMELVRYESVEPALDGLRLVAL
jgi:hypothetical protein